MKKALLIMSAITLVTFFLVQCDPGEDPGPVENTDFSAVEIASNLPFGTTFPTDSNTINGWVANSSVSGGVETNENIIKHGWAIWSGLTQITDQQDNGQNLRVFETWYTPQNVITALDNHQKDTSYRLETVVRKHTGLLKEPAQNFHGHIVTTEDDVVAFVKYNPTAANFAYNQSLFYNETLDSYYKEGAIANMPDFPAGAITTKPVFLTLDSTMKAADGTFIVPSWPGEPQTPPGTAQSFSSDVWPDSIFVSTSGDGNTAKNIYSIEDFIYFKLDSIQAVAFNNANKNTKGEYTTFAVAGDYSILLGMHVSTREIKRWTWQSFWWSRNPDAPHKPSASNVAALRSGAGLDRGANHYAMAIAYSMVVPAQPYYRKDVTDPTFANVAPIFGYNPYLEAGFSDHTFMKGTKMLQDNGYTTTVAGTQNEWGMQSNCMSCHGQATYTPVDVKAKTHYVADLYVGLNDKYFTNLVKVDFAWSVPGNAVPKNPDDRKKD